MIGILHSYLQALAQCETTLSNLGIVRISADDTAGAAKVMSACCHVKFYYVGMNYSWRLNILIFIQMVASAGQRDTGAIASARAADIYGLDILAEKIQVRLRF